MKKMMMALAALCVAGAASAVTVSWTDGNGTTTTTNPNYSEGSMGLGTTTSGRFTVVLTMVTASDVAVATGKNDLLSAYAKFSVEGGRFEWEGFKIAVEGGQWALLKYKDNEPPVGETDLKVGTNGNLSETLNTPEHEVTIAISVDSTTIHAASSDVSGSIFSNGTSVNYGALDLTLKEITGLTVSDVHIYDGVAWSDDQLLKAVPEPTALALLALGVAGLALRRKAA